MADEQEKPISKKVAENEHPNKDAMQQAEREHWARPMDHIETGEVPPGAMTVNLQGRDVVNPTHGFGQLWRRTYRVKLNGVQSSTAEVMKYWKDHFPSSSPTRTAFCPPATACSRASWSLSMPN